MRRLAALLSFALALLPETAAACASCISTPYGDRTFNVAYFGLLFVPFVLVATIGGVLGWAYLRRPRTGQQGQDTQSTIYEERT